MYFLCRISLASSVWIEWTIIDVLDNSRSLENGIVFKASDN